MSLRTTINIGDRFSRLVVESAPYRERRPGAKQARSYVPCVCDCGNRRVVAWSDLKSGNSNSCGCLGRENVIRANTTHHESKTRLYHVWLTMRERCGDPSHKNYSRYGGRGISVCDEWREDFVTFRDWAYQNGYDPDSGKVDNRNKTTLDRIDNDRNYEPGNCRWTTSKEQNRNRCDNRIIAAFGEEKTMSAWVEDPRARVDVGTLWYRISVSNWHPEDAISTLPNEKPKLAQAMRSKIARTAYVFTPDEIAGETWAEIPDWPMYDASDLGRVRSRMVSRRRSADDPPAILKPAIRAGGHPTVTFASEDGRPKIMHVSHLVLMAHVGPRPDGMDACHFPDPSPANCRLPNLRWDTRSNNLLDKRKTNKLILEMIQSE